MSSVERRFASSFREADTDDPGLVQEDDGTVWLVAPNGTRTRLGEPISPAACLLATNNSQQVYPGGGIVQWNVIRLDTDGFMGDPLDPAITPTIPAELDGFYSLDVVVYVQDDVWPRPIRGLLSEPSNSCDFNFTQGNASSNVDWLGEASFVRPLLEGDEITIPISGGPDDPGLLTILGGAVYTTFSMVRVGPLPEGWLRPY